MRQKSFILFVCISILIGFYFIAFSRTKYIGHATISINDVKSITINDTKYEEDKATNLIAEVMSLFNKARIFNKDVGTTPSHKIIITLKNGEEIEILGTSQGFHYVNEG